MRLYDYLDSGNGYKVRLLLAQLGVDYELVPVDILRGESRTADFLQRNPNGRIPLLELDDGSFLAESNAILHYLADGSALLPTERLAHARVLQWMFFEQYSHEPCIATSRFWLRHTPDTPERASKLAGRRDGGQAALALMEEHLTEQPFLVAGRYTIADIALYAYTHVADEGGFPLDDLPAIRAWCERVRSQPGHVAMAAPSPG